MNNLISYFNELNIPYNDDILTKFDDYYKILIEWNKKFNLTNITDKNDVITKHFADSLYGYSFLNNTGTVVDIGSGAGFPSIPLAIVNPDINFTLVDSLNKRISFLNEVIKTLNLKNCIAVHSRAEDFAKNNRNNYDCAIARAVASLPTLLEYLIPLVKKGGKCICYKSQNADIELENSLKAMNILKCNLLSRKDYYILNTDFKRVLLVFNVISPCNDVYPRSGNKPKNNPL